ncbi:hypothetical protein A2863_00900 [Candidatus Woesebacteria bacterium RIFCSPHIGHO2_01_FULL_38_9b]|uniref:DNA-deoxyinosine glycosylase n=1 Tax=Candidatus Woesebacteria bacterium RIFCSPHIGHO2_01_FULL_38_9b TaxID=1802493 RepID=A0A1F7Y5X3_9BACT|nr:MAG: hypothetical protein A2863_00900 [Candidatus Woesebacteria bacterium RIFCSPHIGHO2_01_FULL_38_9b]
MIETHPFGIFVPPRAKYLILGSFTGKGVGINSYDWFYGTKRNQFWPIIESVYNMKLPVKKNKQNLFTHLGIAITDIIYQCERKKASNLDNNLTNIVYNTKGINNIFKKNKIEKIFFSSRFVETRFKMIFEKLINKNNNIQLITLPSPSPRYAAMSIDEKIKRYQSILPKY